MGERSVERSGSRRSLKRVARRQVAALSFAGLVLLLVTAGRARGDRRPHPARRHRRLHQRDGGGALRQRPWARRPGSGWRSARTGRASTSPRVDSNAVARLNRNTTTGAITQPAGAAGCISETGAGPCADGHGLDFADSVAVSPDGKSVYVASVPAATPWRASTATRPPGRSPSPPGPPAASARRGRGPAPTAMGSATRSR